MRETKRWWSAPPLVAIVVAKVVVTLATDGRYGFHRDELYYVATSRRLALGYVDFPPVVPLIARATTTALGDSLLALRIPALIAGVATVYLTAAMARHLGGDRRAQWLAALSITCADFFLGASGLFQTVSFDILAWALALYALVRLVASSEPRWWLAIGGAVGVGMLTKFTTPALVAGLAVATVATPLRRDLRTPWPWAGAVIALAIAAPNLVWQATHDWASVSFLRGQNARVRVENSPLKFVTDQLLILGPIVVIVCVRGARRLWSDARLKALAILVVTVEVVYLVSRGKGYYSLDAFPLLIAAGGVAVASLRRWRLVAALLIAWAALTLPLTLPVLPQRTMLDLGLDKQRDDFSAELGWPTLVATITRAAPPDAMILTANYAQAAAVELLAHRRAYSGHNTYFLWLPKRIPDQVIAVGFRESALHRWFADVERVGAIPNRRSIDVEQRGALIAACRYPRVSAAELWKRVKRYS
jgi:4-amino-4-deoxy-L-arabinose transferase-like glycosyltransferase